VRRDDASVAEQGGNSGFVRVDTADHRLQLRQSNVDPDHAHNLCLLFYGDYKADHHYFPAADGI